MTSIQKKGNKSKPTAVHKQNQSKQHNHNQIFQNQGIANKFNSNVNNASNVLNAGVSFNASTHINASTFGNNLNSTSCNKSKGSRKNSKSTKKYKMSLKQSKDNSHSVSIQRKFSLNRPAKTEPHQNNQNDDILGKLFFLKQKLSKIQYPLQQNIQSISNYYEQIKKSLYTPAVSNNKSKKTASPSLQPLNQIFLFVHQLYVAPLSYILSLLKPFQAQLQRQQQLLQEIRKLHILNERIYQSMSPQDRFIFDMKQKIRSKQQQIQQKKKQKQLNQLMHNASSSKNNRPLSRDGKGRQNFKKKKQEYPTTINQNNKQFLIREQKNQNQDKNNVFHIEDRSIQKSDESQQGQQNKLINEKINEFDPKRYKQQKQKTMCQMCEHNLSKIYCQTEGVYLCNNCDKSHHFNRISNKHKRVQVVYKTQNEKNQENEKNEKQQNNFKQGSMSSSQLEDQQLLPNDRQTNLQSEETADNEKNQNKGMGFSFKLDLGHMGKNPNVGFHDEFYSKLDQFSQSWRNQALKEKRF